MTEKRFKLAYCDYDWWAVCDNESQNELQKRLGISGQEVVNIMNELNNENKQLKQENAKFAKFIRRNHAVGMIHRILTEE